jgi:hypothetical protein
MHVDKYRKKNLVPLLEQPLFFLFSVLIWRQETQNKIKKEERLSLEEKKEEKAYRNYSMFDRKIVQT